MNSAVYYRNTSGMWEEYEENNNHDDDDDNDNYVLNLQKNTKNTRQIPPYYI